MTESSRAAAATRVSGTTRTRRLWRRTADPAAWWPWGILPLVGLAVLFLFGAAVMAPDIQAEVRNHVGDQLSRAGVAVASINADGQQVSARVGGTNYNETTLAALGEAARCETWAGAIRCPSEVSIEQLSVTVPEDSDDVAAAGSEPERAQAGSLTGSLEIPAGGTATPGPQVCNERFAEILANATIQFRTGSADIDAASEPLLADLADVARDCPGRLTIAGHTDSRGDDAMNEALSMARAAAVRDAFAGLGVDARRMTAIGHGESQPVADNASPEGRARNRRIVIAVEPSE